VRTLSRRSAVAGCVVGLVAGCIIGIFVFQPPQAHAMERFGEYLATERSVHYAAVTAECLRAARLRVEVRRRTADESIIAAGDVVGQYLAVLLLPVEGEGDYPLSCAVGESPYEALADLSVHARGLSGLGLIRVVRKDTKKRDIRTLNRLREEWSERRGKPHADAETE